MKKNIGMVDKIIRFSLGALILIWALITRTWWLIAIAAIPIVTAAIGFCPLYLPFGIDTSKKKGE